MAENKANTEATGLDLHTFFGVKAGMTRVFDEAGNHIPVTVIKLIPNYVSQVKTNEIDGYNAYKISYLEKREKLVTKAKKGALAKASISAHLDRSSEIKVEATDASNIGKIVSLGMFSPTTYIDVTGTSKGKGFQGVVKKFHFAGGPATHGSHFHRRPGAIGNRATPGRVFAGKKMPGHLGSVTRTVQNLKIQEINLEKGYLLIKGSIPGSKNGLVRISKATKK